jgi:hypothetical protein
MIIGKPRQSVRPNLPFFAITKLSSFIFAKRLSPALDVNELSSTKALSKNIECLYRYYRKTASAKCIFE